MENSIYFNKVYMNRSTTMDVSDRIKALRKKTGLSQSKFSAKFGIPVRTLQQWEQGISAPPEYLVRMMAYIMLLEEKGGEH
jgi:putative transcriptional regulator